MRLDGATLLGPVVHRVEDAAGGPARGRVVLTLAAVLAVDGADKGTVGAAATNIEDAFSVGTLQIGLLLTVSSLVGAAATLPFGILVDRVRRTRLLALVIGTWAIAMLSGAVAPSYDWLLASRFFLGAVGAAAYPAVASLVGDWFQVAERSRTLGLVLAGDLVGTGLGITLSGVAAAVLSWRLSFALLVVPALLVAVLVGRLPEPERGGADRLRPGEEEIGSGGPPGDGAPSPSAAPGSDADDERGSVAALAAEAGIEPERREPLPDLGRLPLWSAVRYVLGVRTNVILIASSALGYYLFAGVRAFGVEYTDVHYGVGQGLASVLVLVLGAGAVVGVVAGGRFADQLLARGHLEARIVVPAVAFVAAAIAFVPAVVTTSVLAAVPLLVVAGFMLAAANPALDAARLDVMPARLWGRAEGTRTVVRTGFEALAPLVFGAFAAHLFGGSDEGGLEATFVIMSVPLLASGLVLLLARDSYLGDVAAAEAAGGDGQP